MAESSSSDETPDLTPDVPDSSRSSFCASADSSLSASTSTSTSTSISTSILLHSSSSFTLPTRTGVTFAPLPSTEPRRRRSNVQLGVAARSRLLHHRRMLREQSVNPTVVLHSPTDQPAPIPVWDDAADGAPEGDADSARPEHAEDAITHLGKLVKGAGRSLWRSMSKNKKDRPASPAPSPSQSPEPVLNGQADARASPVPKVVKSRLRVAHLFVDDAREEQDGEGAGGVWEEEVGGDTWQQLRTRTLSEGAVSQISAGDDRKYKRTSVVEVLGKRPSPPSPKSR